MVTQYGEVAWDAAEVYGEGAKKGNNNNKDLWLRLSPGDNEMRIVTPAFQYLFHKVKKDESNPKDFGQKVRCSQANGSCELCESGDAAKPRWLFGVIDRKTNSYKVVDVSISVFQEIRKMAKNPKIGDPTKYDINIVVDPKGGATGYYSVQKYDKEPLTAGEQVIKDNADLEELRRLSSPLSPEKLSERVSKIRGDAPVQTKAAAPAPKKAAPPVVNMNESTDDGEDFPDYQT